MMTLMEKVAYLKGVADGAGIDTTKGDGKVISYIVETLEEMAASLTAVDDRVSEMGLQVDEIDDDLAAIEEEWYDDDECDCDECDDECDDECECDDDTVYEVECPVCGNTVCVDESILDDGYIDCPNCGEKLEFEFDEDDCDCECDDCCGCGCENNEEV